MSSRRLILRCRGLVLACYGLLLSLCVLSEVASAQGVRAWFDRDTVYEDDTVTLIIEAEKNRSGVQPDLSPLYRDFALLGTNSSTQVSIINGRYSAKQQWRVELEPKHTGEIRIPALTVGTEQSAPLRLRVTAQPLHGSAQKDAKLFIEVEAEPQAHEVYVHAEIRYRVRLFHAVPLWEGTLSDPEPSGAMVERLGQGSAYRTHRQGRQYRVVERRYAIFPEQSGELTVPGVTLVGRTPAKGRSRAPLSGRSAIIQRFFSDPFFSDPFFSSGPSSRHLLADRGQQVRIRGETLTFNVLPRPAGYGGRYWLPSAQLTLQARWSGDPSGARVGEPITRTVTMEAKGLAASQIPNIDLPAVSGARIYPEPPVTETNTDGRSLIGQWTKRVAMVPTQTGELRIPQLELRWWDTDQHHERVARLPAHTLQVLPAGNTLSSTDPRPAANGQEPDGAGSANASIEEAAAPSTHGRLWPWFAGGLVMLWLATLVAWWVSRWRGSRPTGLRQAPVRVETARRALQEACRRNDAPGAARALLNWGAAEWPTHPPSNLGDLAARLVPRDAPVRELDRTLYGSGGAQWRGDRLWEAIKEGAERRPGARSSKASPLPELYPRRA